MAWSGGNFTRANPTWVSDASAGIGIEAARHDTQDNDFTTGINECLNKAGQNAMGGTLSMGTNKISNLGAGTLRNDAAQVGQIQDGDFIWLGTTGGTAAAQTASATPAITAYKAGQKFRFISGFATSAAVTLNVNSLGAKSIVDAHTGEGLNTVLAFNTNDIVEVIYDGTFFKWNSGTTIARFSADTVPNILYFYKSRGASVGTNTLVNNGDQLGQIQFLGAANTAYVAAAAIGAVIDGVPSAGSSDMPGRLVFSTTADASGSPTERMRIDSLGNVGIGGSSTAYRFYAKGIDAGTGNYTIVLQNSANTTLQSIRNDGLFNTGLAANSPYNLTTGAAANMVVDLSGNVLRFSSSLRYKTNIQDAHYGLTEVLNLRPVTYQTYNDGDLVFGGLIAEEVDAIGLSEFVQYNVAGEPDAIHYSNMVALAFKAIQELNAKVEALEARIAALEA